MDARFTIAQITGALPPGEALKIVRLIKPETDQALVVHLDRSSKLDLTAIGDEKVTFVHVSDSLVILFDNHSTVTVDPFYDSRGLPLANISVELNADRSVSGAEFASLFPITTDQSILPAAANTGSPPSGANFESATVDQFPNNPVPLALLGPDTQAGLGPNDTGIPTIHTPTVAVNVNPLVQGAIPSQGAILSVHDVGGNEDRPIALGITDALSAADTGASLGNLTITGVPAGATLSAGIHNADGSWTLTPAQLTGLALTSDGEVQHFTLTVQATTIGGTTTDVSTASINVSITPVADAPTLTIGASGLSATVSGNEDQAIALPIKTALGEADADAVLSVSITGVPAGVTLSAGTHNADGSWTLTPAQLSGLTLTSDSEVQHFNLTVTATTVDGGSTATAASVSGTLHVDVTPVPETPTLDTSATPASINEGSTITLNLMAHFEADMDASNTIVISGLPSGVTLNHGSFDQSTDTYTLSQADLVGLTLTAPHDDTKQITFTVTAHASEGGIDAASTPQTVTLTVNPVAEAPVLMASATATSVNEDGGTVGLNITATPAENDADATTSVTISGLGTATLTDMAGDTFSGNTVTLTQAQLNGLTLHAADDDTASLHLTVTATTVDGGTSSAASAAQTINLTVNPVAEAPVLMASAAATSVNEDSNVALNITATPAENDADATTSVTISGLGTATLTDMAGDTFSGNTVTLTQAQLNGLTLHAADDDTASLHLTVTASTSEGTSSASSAAQTINLTVNPVAEAPVLTASAAATSVNEDSNVALNITATPAENDADATTSVTISGLGTATLTDMAGDTFSGNTVTLTQAQLNGLTLHAADDDTASLHLTVTASTSEGTSSASSAAQTINLTVNPVAEAPVLTASATATSVNEDSNVALSITATPAEAGDTDASTTVTITGLGTATLTDMAGDTFSGNTVTLTQAQLNGLTLHAADDDTASLHLTVTASTSEGTSSAASAAQTINLTVNPVAEAPVLTASATATSVNEDGGTVGLNITATPAENDADATTSVTISGLGTATLTDAAGDTFSGNTVTLTQAQLNGLTLHAADDDTASLHLTVTASTSEGTSSAASAAQQINLTVNPVAGTPVLTVPHMDIGFEDHPIILGINAALGEIDNDAILSITLSGLPTSGASLSDSNGDVLTIAPNGSITLTPAELAGLSLTTNGPQTVNLTVTATTVDGGNASTAASTSAALTVISQALLPVLTLQSHNVSGNEDQPIALGISAAPGAPDPGADVSVTISGLPTSGVHLSDSNGDVLTIQPGGSISLNSSELAGLTLTSDGEAQHFDLGVSVTEFDNGFQGTVGGTLHVDVTPVADKPTLTIGASGSSATVSGNEDKAIALPITAALGETDADAVLTVTITGVPSGATLSAGTLNANGSWTLTPAQLSGLTLTSDGEVQHFNLTVTATTVDGGDAATAASTSGTFTVNVTPVADAPMLTIGASGSSATVSGNEDNAIALPITAALGEADADAVLSVTITGVPAGVTLSAGTHNANGSWTLTPAQLAGLTLTSDGEVQNFNLTVTATTVDGGDAATAASTSGSFTVHVTPVADAPMLTIGASGLSATVSGNEETAIALPIQAALGEVDADAVLSVTITGVPSGVTLSAGTHNADGSWTLTPAQLSGLTLTGDGEVQNFNLTVTATTVDGGDAATAASTSGTFTVNVTPVADLGFISPVLAVSTDANGNHFGALLSSIGVDGNGAEVVFEAGAPATFDSQVWVKNLQTGSLTLESTDANGNAALHNATAATISGASIDGAGDLVAFASNATNLGSNPTGSFEIFIKNIVTGQVTLASTNASGVLLAGSNILPAISADGTTVTFQNVSQQQVFQKNLATGALTLVSADAHGNAANAAVDNVAPAVSSNGNIVAFDTTATNLSANATDGKMEIFVKNLATGAVTLASADANGHEANAAASQEVISANGRFVAFASTATNLTANATSGKDEIFVKDLQTGAVVLASADANGVAGTGFSNDTPSISADGRFVTFDTSSANLTGTTQTEIVKKDLLTGALTIVSTDANGNLGNGISNSAVISADGGVVVGSTHATNLGASPPSFPVQLFAKEQNVALGAAGKPIAIPLQFLEVDPDATSLILSGIPTGVTFSNTANTVPPIVNGSVTLTQAELAGLTLTSDGTVPVFNLVVSGIDGGVASVSTTIEVEVATGSAAPATSSLHAAATPALGATSALGTISVEAQFDAAHNVLDFNNHTIETSTTGQTVQLTDAGHPGATLNASGNRFIASGTHETLDLSGWDRAIEINFAAGTIRLDANSLTQSGSISGFANIVGTAHNDSFDNLTGGVAVTGGAGAVDHFGLAANVLSSSSIPTITNFSSGKGETIDLSALLDAKFGPGSDPTKAASFVQVKEDAGGNSATLEINVSGASGGAFVAAAHLGGVHSGDVVTAILDHAHTTAQLHAG